MTTTPNDMRYEGTHTLLGPIKIRGRERAQSRSSRGDRRNGGWARKEQKEVS